jgi:hypothetical protein
MVDPGTMVRRRRLLGAALAVKEDHHPLRLTRRAEEVDALATLPDRPDHRRLGRSVPAASSSAAGEQEKRGEHDRG